MFPRLVWCEIFGKIILRDKHLQKFKASRPNIVEQLYKEAKANMQKLVKKRDFHQEILRENVSKPKELWKSLKSLGVPAKITPVSQISFKVGEKFPLMNKQTITPSIILMLI